jgi:hypothetical protein
MSLDIPLTLRKPWLLHHIASLSSRTFSMIVKAESPPPVQSKPFHLSFLDQNVVRVYTQTLTIFPVSVTAWPSPSRNIDSSFSFLIRMKPRQPSRHSLKDFV